MSSKRQRKHKNLGSLKSKQHAPNVDAMDLMVDEEGMLDLGGAAAALTADG
jgi:hypothetical protein